MHRNLRRKVFPGKSRILVKFSNSNFCFVDLIPRELCVKITSESNNFQWPGTYGNQDYHTLTAKKVERIFDSRTLWNIETGKITAYLL